MNYIDISISDQSAISVSNIYCDNISDRLLNDIYNVIKGIYYNQAKKRTSYGCPKEECVPNIENPDRI